MRAEPRNSVRPPTRDPRVPSAGGPERLYGTTSGTMPSVAQAPHLACVREHGLTSIRASRRRPHDVECTERVRWPSRLGLDVPRSRLLPRIARRSCRAAHVSLSKDCTPRCSRAKGHPAIAQRSITSGQARHGQERSPPCGATGRAFPLAAWIAAANQRVGQHGGAQSYSSGRRRAPSSIALRGKWSSSERLVSEASFNDSRDLAGTSSISTAPEERVHKCSTTACVSRLLDWETESISQDLRAGSWTVDGRKSDRRISRKDTDRSRSWCRRHHENSSRSRRSFAGRRRRGLARGRGGHAQRAADDFAVS